MTREEKKQRAATNAKIKADELAAYMANPKLCGNCQTPIEFKKRHTNEYCSRACSATKTNSISPKRIASIKNEAICIICNTSFYNTGHRQYSTCSIACRQIHSAEQLQHGLVNGLFSAGKVKKHLLQIHGNKCLDPSCAWDFEKRSLNVELEHIDGNSSNNRLDNCTLLCPNCHSLTATYKGRNLGNGRRALKRAKQEGIE